MVRIALLAELLRRGGLLTAYGQFASLVIKDLGYTQFQTVLYTAPSGAVQIAMLWVGVAGCMVFPRDRTMVASALVVPPLVGSVCLLRLSLGAGWGMIVASWLASCITAPWSVLISLTASNVKGNTKRSVVNAMFFMGYCAGCIGAPQLWTSPPRYFSGVVTAIATWCLLFLPILAYRLVCGRENARRDGSLAGPGGAAGRLGDLLDEKDAANLDLTDRQHRDFRYSL